MESNERGSVSSASQGITTSSSQSSDSNYAFQMLSQDSLSQDTPPDIDNQHLVRQKRRRTRLVLFNITETTMFVD